MTAEAPGSRPSRSVSAYRFGVTSVAAFATNFGVTVALHELLGIAPPTAYAIALALVFLQSFLFLRFYVYGRQVAPWTTQMLVYGPSAVVFRGAEFVAFLLLHDVIGIDYRLVIVLIALASFVTKFVFYGKVVFRG